MKQYVRTLLAATTAAASLLAAGQVAQAAYPDRPIRVIVPFPPGGGTDIVGRTVLNRMAQELGQPLVVENRAGAGTQIGTQAVAGAPADGYTLLYTSSAFSVNPSLVDTVQYDPIGSFQPIGLAAFHPFVLLAHPSVPAASVAELLAHAKANPGKLNYASVGVGSSQHLGMELLKRMAGVDILHVPYGGSAPAMQDLLGGQIDLMFNGISPSLGQIRDGRLKALATDSRQRVPLLSEVPTVDESGLPGFSITTWSGLLAPTGVSAEVRDKLEDAMQKALKDPDLQKNLAERGLIPADLDATEFQAFLAEDVKEWQRLIDEAGARQGSGG